jgi:mono/diheme cytochrome c family protein
MRILVALVIAALLALGGAAAFVYSGVYNLAATDQHTAPVFWLLNTVMRRAVHHHARDIEAPPLDDPALIERGRLLYRDECARCHGAPGVAPEAFALGMRPPAANLANAALEWQAPDLFWTIKKGLKLTGMPAWEFRLRDDTMWAIVAYVQRMPYESPPAYEEALRASGQSQPADRNVAPVQDRSAPPVEPRAKPGNAERGRHVLQQYACVACHEIPGAVGASVPVGPPLDHMARRAFIAGVIQNTPQNMIAWLQAPKQFVPDGAMPNLGVTEQDATDMAAYLLSLQ